ncbi:MAG: hypothetical protein ACD_33C00008G0005 [uncultured bacterium]|nr:MAG: hypothetical protein ACD_33C00008G0005 [uncultured bacterium]
MSKKQSIHSLIAIIRDKKGNILSIGKNLHLINNKLSYKSHPYMRQLAFKENGEDSKKIFLHAEIDAILKCDNINKAYEIQVFRYNKKEDFLCSKPCDICLSGIKKTNIKLVTFVDSDKHLVTVNIEEL